MQAQGKIDPEAQRNQAHDQIDVLEAARQQLDAHPAHKAETKARGDVEGQGHAHDGQKGGQGHGEVREADAPHLLHHQRAHDDQHGRGGERRHQGHQGREKQREKEQPGNDHGGQAGAAALGHARGAFQIAGGR